MDSCSELKTSGDKTALQGIFETTFCVNKGGLKTTIAANETTIAANKPHDLQISYKPYTSADARKTDPNRSLLAQAPLVPTVSSNTLIKTDNTSNFLGVFLIVFTSNYLC